MTDALPDERRFTCPDCGCSDMIAWASERLPVLPFVYTCPRCKRSMEVAFADPPPVQPTDPAGKQVEGALYQDAPVEAQAGAR